MRDFDPNDDTLERELQAWKKNQKKSAGPRRKKRKAHLRLGAITTRLKNGDEQ